MTKIKGAGAQRNTLKNIITDHVKGLGWKDHYENCSAQGKHHSVLDFQEHLLHITHDSQSKNK